MSKFWTENGLVKLGRVVKSAREARGWSLRDVEREIKARNPHREDSPTYETVKSLETGKRHPRWNTVVAIASVGFVLHPKSGKPFSEDELSDIAAEHLDPDTGWYSLPPAETPTISQLIQIEIKNRSWLGLEQLAEDTEITTERLEQLIDGAMPTDSEICNLAQELRKSESQWWDESELLEIVVAEFGDFKERQ